MTDIRAVEDCASGSSAMAVVRAGTGGRPPPPASRRHLDSCGGKPLLTRGLNLLEKFVHGNSFGKHFNHAVQSLAI